MLNPVVPLAEKAEHMDRVHERWNYLMSPVGQAYVNGRAATIGERIKPEQRAAMVRQARDSKTAKQRVMWLRREADLLVNAARGNAACGAGCSHCCHIGVTINESEARVIATETGRTLATPPAERTLRGADLIAGDDPAGQMRRARAWTVDHYFGVACPFLVDERCSIYEFRPIACRLQINVDSDALLCRLVPGNEQGDRIRVPYVDTRSSQMASVAVLGPYAPLADIRDWFPSPATQAHIASRVPRETP